MKIPETLTCAHLSSPLLMKIQARSKFKTVVFFNMSKTLKSAYRRYWYIRGPLKDPMTFFGTV